MLARPGCALVERKTAAHLSRTSGRDTLVYTQHRRRECLRRVCRADELALLNHCLECTLRHPALHRSRSRTFRDCQQRPRLNSPKSASERRAHLLNKKPSAKMYCAISGEIPQQPVVSRKTGHLFERRLIEKALQASENRCPVTGEELKPEDLLPVACDLAQRPRPLSATSLPAMLAMFQNEWDDLVVLTAASWGLSSEIILVSISR